MSRIAAALFDIAKLERIETYAFYDRSLLFSCKDEEGSLFLALMLHACDTVEVWIFAPVGHRRYEELKAGAVDLRDAFRESPGRELYQVSIDSQSGAQVKARVVDATKLPLAWLPDEGVKLVCPE